MGKMCLWGRGKYQKKKKNHQKWQKMCTGKCLSPPHAAAATVWAQKIRPPLHEVTYMVHGGDECKEKKNQNLSEIFGI